ncbi:ATP-binding cassette domain-containing protein [Pigmentiphaga soli]|uniref:Glutathione import ATP-binding protein GsiA n=1 Tax=Pigmentiphaga soli TaxID=1007095 RepID=A0ABP8HIG4_9BURK
MDLQESEPERGGPAQPLLIAKGLVKHFPVGSMLAGGRKLVRAVDGVDLSVRKHETLGIVGESGCGKSTVSRLIMALVAPTAGEIIFDGDPVGSHRGISLRDYRRQVQMVFQDSYSSLNPRLTIEESIAYGPLVHGVGRREASERARDLLSAVGLAPRQYARRFPHELSGGQRQRVNIARALALRPRLIILDEPVSALDKSVEAQVLNLLVDLKEQFGLTYLFISHDLNVVQHVADRVLVMYLGKVVEIGPVDAIFSAPAHPYTQALMNSRPSMDPARRRTEPPLKGDPPNPIEPPSGCRFHTRCPIARGLCATAAPALLGIGQARQAACHAAAPGSGFADSDVMEAA